MLVQMTQFVQNTIFQTYATFQPREAAGYLPFQDRWQKKPKVGRWVDCVEASSFTASVESED